MKSSNLHNEVYYRIYYAEYLMQNILCRIYYRIYYAVISLDFTLKKDDNYYPHGILRECKYIERKVVRYINDNLSACSSSDDESNAEQIGLG